MSIKCDVFLSNSDGLTAWMTARWRRMTWISNANKIFSHPSEPHKFIWMQQIWIWCRFHNPLQPLSPALRYDFRGSDMDIIVSSMQISFSMPPSSSFTYCCPRHRSSLNWDFPIAVFCIPHFFFFSPYAGPIAAKLHSHSFKQVVQCTLTNSAIRQA